MSANGSWQDDAASFLLGLPPAARCSLITCETERPVIRAAKEGDVIEVVQPDGERETYRLTSATPTADGFGVTFEMEPVP